MATEIFIDGVDRTSDIVPSSLDVSHQITRKNDSMSFRLIDASLPSSDNIVEWYEDSVLKFAGKAAFIDNTSPLPLKDGSVVVNGWYESLMGELVREIYENNTVIGMMKDIAAKYIYRPRLKMMLEFDEGTGTTVYDYSENDNDATAVGSGSWNTTDYGYINSGATGNYLTVADDGTLDFSSQFSFGIDFKADTLDRVFFAKPNGSGDRPYRVVINADGSISLDVGVASTTTTITSAAGVISTGTRYQVVCGWQKSNGAAFIMVDGEIIKTDTLTTSALNVTTDDLVIGGDTTSATNTFDGEYYRIGFYNEYLSTSDARRWCKDLLEVKIAERNIDYSNEVIVRAVFPYEYPADCFSAIANEIGLNWYIDQYMNVKMQDQSLLSYSQTYDEDDGISIIKGSLKYEQDTTQIRNAVYVRGGVYATAWESSTILTNGTNRNFGLPYKYDGFEMFTDTPSLCNYVGGWWKMNDASGNLTDETGTHTLTAVGLTYGATGQIGDAITFDGSTTSARKTSAGHVTGSDSHSLAVWFNPDLHDTTERILMGIGDFSAGHSKLSLDKDGSDFKIKHSFGDGIDNEYISEDLTGGWHFVAMSWNADTSKLIVKLNGSTVIEESIVALPDIDAGVIEIGGDNLSNVFDGDIDECSYFEYGLSEQELCAIYLLGNEGSSGLLLRSGVEFLNDTGFDAYYNYNEKNYKFDIAPASGIELYFTGEPQNPVQALKKNNDSITQWGRRELEIIDTTIESIISARQRASAELAIRKDKIQKVKFSTYRMDLEVGQIVRLTLPSYGLASKDLLIQKIGISHYLHKETDSKKFIYTVECVNKPVKDYLDFLRTTFRKNKSKIDPREGEVISDLVSHEEDLQIADVHTVKVPLTQSEDLEIADVHNVELINSGGYRWSNVAGTTPRKLRWNLGDWGAVGYIGGVYAQSASAASLTFALESRGTNRVAVVYGHDKNAGSSIVTGVTYGGQAMTLATSVKADRWTTCWYLVNPPLGTHNVVVTASSSDNLRFSGMIYEGANQTTPIDATTTKALSTTHSIALTSINDNARMICFGKDGAGGRTYTSTTNDIERLNGDGGGHFIFDNGGRITPAGSTTMAFTQSGTPNNEAMIAITINPA